MLFLIFNFDRSKSSWATALPASMVVTPLDESLPPTGQGEMTFQLDTVPTTDPPVFTLTTTSTGVPGPAVSWRRDGTLLSDDNTHSITSQVTNSGTATFTHTLTVTGRLVGEYQCNMFNSRTPLSSLTVVGKEHKNLWGVCKCTHNELS